MLFLCKQLCEGGTKCIIFSHVLIEPCNIISLGRKKNKEAESVVGIVFKSMLPVVCASEHFPSLSEKDIPIFPVNLKHNNHTVRDK